MSETLLLERDQKIANAKAIVEGAKAAERHLDANEIKIVEELAEQVKALNEQILNAAKARNIMDEFTQMQTASAEKSYEEKRAESLGLHVVKSADLAELKAHMSSAGATRTFDEYFKAASDTHTVPTTPAHLILPDIDRNIVRPFRQRLWLADWLLGGTIDSNAITYFVEKVSGAVEGDFTTVAEEGKAPQLHFGGYDAVTETLRKIMGYIKISKEMLEDAAFLTTEINTRLLEQMAIMEEKMLLDGDGAGTNVKGLLRREGLQTKTATNVQDSLDVIYKAMTGIEVATGFTADAIIINPADYEEIRLMRDQNGQYYAGGPFSGAYGNGGFQIEPPIWGINVIKTPAIPAKTILVGSGQAATVYRKGGISVETAFQNEDDFLHDRVAIRARQRVAMAVRQPSAFCKITING